MKFALKTNNLSLYSSPVTAPMPPIAERPQDRAGVLEALGGRWLHPHAPDRTPIKAKGR